MIGVAVRPGELEVVREFFELFKTPWEPAVPGERYRAALLTGDAPVDIEADVALIFSRNQVPRLKEPAQVAQGVVCWGRERIPLYGKSSTFEEVPSPAPITIAGLPAASFDRQGHRIVWRIGYDLFYEIRHLLTVGQPAEWSLNPSLELHIGLLRHLLLSSGVTFAEVPPRPDAADFICCLTHDIDFVGLRRQRSLRSLAGFAYRASVGTVIDVLHRRRTLRDGFVNWKALVSLPLVFLRFVEDPWRPFRDYLAADRGLPSTYFLVPFRGRPGIPKDGVVAAARSVSYDLEDVRSEVLPAAKAGCEFAVHGIDAWGDTSAGRAELERVATVTGASVRGIRMHWLYFDEASPTRLEAAGFGYDSTWGYNDAVGFRAGTSQPFRPLGCDSLIELPLSIMDSAMFSRGRMGLSDGEADAAVDRILAIAHAVGGTIVVNWHCRSLAPERLWGRFYQHLLNKLASEKAWFVSAGEAVDWFAWRRSLRFDRPKLEDGRGVVVIAPTAGPRAGVLRVWRPGSTGPEDLRLSGRATTEVCFSELPASAEAS